MTGRKLSRSNRQSRRADDFLENWQQKMGFTHDQAAKALGACPNTYRNWKNGKPIGRGKLPGALKGLGTTTLEEARLQLGNHPNVVRVFSDFDQREYRLHELFSTAKKIRETRIMLPGYEASNWPFRKDLNSRVHRRVLDKELSFFKIEQISNLTRVLDLINNLRTFSDSSFEVKILSHAKQFIPYWNFIIFDESTVVAGGTGELTSPKSDNFVEYNGSEFVRFYAEFWLQLWATARPLSSVEYVGELAKEVRELGDEHREMSEEQLSLLAEERRRDMKHPPRV